MSDCFDTMKAQKDAILARDNEFLHKRRGELVIERDRARAALTRVYDILARISEECEVGDDGYVRFGSQNDYDTLRDLVSELEADALAEHRSATAPPLEDV